MNQRNDNSRSERTLDLAKGVELLDAAGLALTRSDKKLLKEGGRILHLATEPEGGSFPLGRIAVTPAADAALAAAGQDCWDILARHVKGDWGRLGCYGRNEDDAPDDDTEANRVAVGTGKGKVMSAYWLSFSQLICVTTKLGRRPRTSVTLAEEWGREQYE